MALALDMPPQDTANREAAQTAFVNYINKNAKAVPLLVARFIARQVANETTKLMPNAGAQLPSELPEAESGNYTMYDHIERLRYLEVNAPAEEIKIVSQVLSTALPGLEQFVTEERHATLLGKMAYNSYGVCFGGGRDDKVCFDRELMYECRSSSDCSPSPHVALKMLKRHGHHTELRSKSVVVYISLQHMYVLVSQVTLSNVLLSRRLIHAPHLCTHPLATEQQNFTSLQITLSRRVKRLLYPTSTVPKTLKKRSPRPGDVVV